jgi:hypothetical protein
MPNAKFWKNNQAVVTIIALSCQKETLVRSLWKLTCLPHPYLGERIVLGSGCPPLPSPTLPDPPSDVPPTHAFHPLPIYCLLV